MSGRDRNVNEITISASYTVPLDMDYVFVDGPAADVTITLKRTKDRLVRWHKVKLVAGNGHVVTVTDGASLSYPLSADGEAAVFEIDKDGDFHVFSASALGASGGLAIPAGGSVTYSPTEYDAVGSFQPIAPDLNLAAGAGSDDGADPSYLGTIMGNVLGADLTEDSNYIGGVIGAYSVTGAKASNYPTGAVLAQITDGVTEVQGAVTAYIDGDGTQTNANAAFAIMQNNSVPGSGFDWVVDGHGEAHDGYNAAVPIKGFARVNVNSLDLPVGIYFGVATDDAGIVAQVGADATIGDGSLYISHVAGAGKLFQKQNDVWVDLQA